MKFISSKMNLIKQMKLIDVSIYKTYSFACWLLLAHLFPWFNSINPLIWLIIWLVLIGYLMTFTYKKRWDTKWYIETVLSNFREYSLLDALAFEFWMVAFWLALYQYIPQFWSVSTYRYFGIVIFWFARLASLRAHK